MPADLNKMRALADSKGVQWGVNDTAESIAVKLLPTFKSAKLTPELRQQLTAQLSGTDVPAEAATPEQTAAQGKTANAKNVAAMKGGTGRAKAAERLGPLYEAQARDAATGGMPSDVSRTPVRPMGGAMIDALEGLGGGIIRGGLNAYEGARDLYNWGVGNPVVTAESGIRPGLDEMRQQHPMLHNVGQGMAAAPMAMVPGGLPVQMAMGALGGTGVADPGTRSMGAVMGGAAPVAGRMIGAVAGNIAGRVANSRMAQTLRGYAAEGPEAIFGGAPGGRWFARPPVMEPVPPPQPFGGFGAMTPEPPMPMAPPPTDPAVAASRFAAGRPQFAEQAAERYRAGQPQFASPPMRTAPEAMPPHPTSFYATKPPLRHGTPNLDYVLEGFDPIGAGTPPHPAYNEYLDWASGGVTAPDPTWVPRQTPLGPGTAPVGDPFVSTPWGTAMSPEEAAYVQRVMSGAHGYGTPPIDAEFTVTPPRALPPPQRLLPAPKPQQ